MLRLVLLAVLLAPSSEGAIMERVVAVVRSPPSSPPRPVTLTRLVEEARVALVGQGAVEAAFAPLDDEALRPALRWLVDQLLVSEEAVRLKVDEVARTDVAAAQRRFAQQFPDEATFRRFLAVTELPEDELGAILARSIRVQRYLDSRIGRGARVSDEELAAWLRAHEARLESPAAREAVRARLAEDKTRTQVKALLADLRGRADVRILVPELRGEPAR